MNIQRTVNFINSIFVHHTRACTGFDRDLEDGEAIRRKMRQIANLNLNANDNFELAAA